MTKMLTLRSHDGLLSVKALSQLSPRRLCARANYYLGMERRALRRENPQDYRMHAATFHNAWLMRVYQYWPPARSWTWPLIPAMGAYSRSIDGVVDDGTDPDNQTAALSNTGVLLKVLAGRETGPVDHTFTSGADSILVWIIKAAARNGVDVLPDLFGAFDGFAVDAERIIAQRPVPTDEEFAATVSGNFHLGVIYALLGGLDQDTADKIAKIVMLLVFWTDTLMDLEDDLNANGADQIGRISFPESACVGFTTAQLLACHTWAQLGQIPGFIPWYNGQVAHWQSYWDTVAVGEINRVLALIPPGRRHRRANRIFHQYTDTVQNALAHCRARYPHH
jgi:hypothetical protein